MGCIQCLKFLWRQRQCQRDGVLLYMRDRTRFGNCNHVTTADGPGQRNGGCRTTVRYANTCKRGITQQAGSGAAQRRIGHHRHAMPLTPWQQATFNAAVVETVRDLIGHAAIALWNLAQFFHVADFEVGHAQGRIFPAACRSSKALTTWEKSVTPFGQCSR